MPGKPARLFPLLLPAVVCIPLAAALIVLLSAAWHASDTHTAADARRADAALRAQTALADEVKRQQAATEHLGRSPLVWLWVKFQGERLTASNRSHAANSLVEIANYAGLQPGSAISMGSAKTGLLYRDGAPVRALKQSNPDDAWYFDALKTDALLTVVSGSSVRASARLMNGGNLLGVITDERAFADIAAEVFPAVLPQRGITAVLAEQEGRVLFVSAPGGSSAQTLADLFPGARSSALISLLSRAGSAEGTATLEVRTGRRTVGITAVGAPQIKGVILIAAEVSPTLPWTRLGILVLVAAACLALTVGALAAIAARRISGVSALRDRHERESQSARTAFTRIDASVRSAQSAAANLRSLAGSLGKEATAGVTSGEEAIALFSRAEEQDTELRAGIMGRAELLNELAVSLRAALDQSRGTQAALLSLGPEAARAEEELSRVITLGSSAAGAVERAAKGVESLREASGRLSLLAVNASIEAVRAGPAGQKLARLAEEVRGLAEEASGRARLLATALAEAGERLAGTTKAARQAGEAVHVSAAAAEKAGSGPAQAWEIPSTLLAGLDNAGVSAGRLRAQAERTDRGRSALEGMAAIIARIRVLAGQAADLAGSVATDTEGAARAAASMMQDR